MSGLGVLPFSYSLKKSLEEKKKTFISKCKTFLKNITLLDHLLNLASPPLPKAVTFCNTGELRYLHQTFI